MSMTLHVGTKGVLSKPMSRGEYNAYRGWTPPEGEDQDVDGYLVEYVDGGEPNDDRHIGYISWSPKDVFEASYSPSGEMSFGHALLILERGGCVARSGWNGKGMFVYRVAPGSYKPSAPAAHYIAADNGGLVPYTAYLAIKSVDGSVSPWAPSQTDVLAGDWGIVEPAEAMDAPNGCSAVAEQQEE